MSQFHYSDIECLNVELPEDILKKKWFGDFEGAIRLIDIRLNTDIPNALKKKLELEKIIIATLQIEYTLPFDEALAMVQEVIPKFTKEEFLTLQDESKIDWIYVNGEVRYFRRFLSTLLKVNEDLIRRAKDVRMESEMEETEESSIDTKEKRALKEVVFALKEKKQLTYHFKIRASVTIKEQYFQPGKVCVHLPIPVDCSQVKAAKILRSEPNIAFVAKDKHPQRTVFFEENLQENRTFSVEYEYDNTIVYLEPDENLVGLTKQPSIAELISKDNDSTVFVNGNEKEIAQSVLYEDLSEQAPHIMFTPYMRALAEEIIEGETNVYRKARRIYDFVTTKIKYSFMREYLTIENIPEYAALGGKGDCGVQALVFIVLCRIVGIPARWQSGLYTTPFTAGSHDWAQFYVAPYGWLFADCSFGGSAYREGDYDRWNFYFGNLDPFRMPANAAFQKEFDPPKKFLRADPYDNQRGEIEYETRGLAYHEFDAVREILECYEVEKKSYV